MTATEVREALHQVAAATSPPPVDRLAFQAAVRTERRRRLGSRAGAVAAAAAALALLTAGVSTLVGGHPAAVAPAGPGSVALQPGSVPEPVYFVRSDDHRLVALDPHGVIHPLLPSSEGVVGANAELVLALDDESRVLRFDVDAPVEGPDGDWAFRRGPSPVRGPVDSIAMSGDGRYVAWRDLDGRLTTLDLKSGSRGTQEDVDDGSVVSVSDAGVLLSDGDQVFLETPDGQRVDVPGPGVAQPTLAQGAMVSVSSDTRTTVLELRDDRLVRVDQVEGAGTLSPDGRSMLVVRTTADDRTTLLRWSPDGIAPVTGLTGYLEQLSWFDERTALVAAGARLFSCDVQRLTCGVLPVTGGVRIGP